MAIETFSPGHTREIALPITIIRGNGKMSQHDIDSFFDLIEDTIQFVIKSDPVVLLVDVSKPEQGISPYARQRVERLYQLRKDGRHYIVAVLVRNIFVQRFLNLILMRWMNKKIKIRLFSDEEIARQWLIQQTKPQTTQLV